MKDDVSPREHCWGQRRYPNQGLTERALCNLWAAAGRDHIVPGELPCRAYECDCGGWHLTSSHKEMKYAVSVR
jgi:hypothetical protein